MRTSVERVAANTHRSVRSCNCRVRSCCYLAGVSGASLVAAVSHSVSDWPRVRTRYRTNELWSLFEDLHTDSLYTLVKIGTRRGATRDRATSSRAERDRTINQTPSSPWPDSFQFFSPFFLLFLSFLSVQPTPPPLSRSGRNSERREEYFLSRAKRFRERPSREPSVLSRVCLRSTARQGRARRCSKLRANKSLWYHRGTQIQLCNDSACVR